MSEISRRNLFRAAGVLGASAAIPAELRAEARQSRPSPAARQQAHPKPAARAPYRFFNTLEAAFIEAAVDRLIPPDSQWTGAVGAGVPGYIDLQLAGAYGQGARLYRSGPWDTGLPSQGYQLALTPAQLYRTAIASLDRQLKQHVSSGAKNAPAFARLSSDDQDGVLRDLEAGKMDLSGIPSAVFFETLLANTIEGFFSDPMYGGNRDMVGWRMIGFPGAYATYLGIYTNHGERFTREPMSIAQSPQEHHPMPGGLPPFDSGVQRRG
ncbi:gluconate 2-dehydrogenase subunit 3 family protein [Microvirga sp. TS319]|uniref:gluconate 2-dehydrogenase subunit 3 family protein n=1 Tax=Microvirga sp. TS319 TaxID=3241165 RepID=UPI00351A7761